MECPKCQHQNPEGQKFCGECASPLAAASSPPEGERRQATIVFSDLSGYMAMNERLDPEEVLTEKLSCNCTWLHQPDLLLLDRSGLKVRVWTGGRSSRSGRGGAPAGPGSLEHRAIGFGPISTAGRPARVPTAKAERRERILSFPKPNVSIK